jgi:RHS repeat-associated protein
VRLTRNRQERISASVSRATSGSAATGLDYAQNRTYDSKQGRFTQVDPIGMGDVRADNPQSLNLYNYCHNDPINNADPSGLGFFSFLKKLFKWVMIAIVVATAILTVVGTVMMPAAFTAFTHTLLGQILTFMAGLPSAIGGAITGAARAVGGIFSFIAEATKLQAIFGWGVLAAGAVGSSIADHFARSTQGRAQGGCNFYVWTGGWLPKPATPVSASGSGTTVTIRYSNGGVETRTGGSRAWRNNNPGNIGRGSSLPGNIGSAGGFTIFDSEASGQAAISGNLRRSVYQSKTLDGAVEKWAPPDSNPTAVYQALVRRETGLDGNTIISTLNQGQLDSVANAIRLMEGWRPGKVTCQRGGK